MCRIVDFGIGAFKDYALGGLWIQENENKLMWLDVLVSVIVE